MKIVRFEADGKVSYGILKGTAVIDAGARLRARFPDPRSIIGADGMDALEKVALQAPDHELETVRILKPIAQPGKIICVGVNYPERNAEYKDSSDQPRYPSIFTRFPASLVAHGESVVRPPESKQLDYEGEVAVVIGRKGRRMPESEALSHIAGYTICNEGTIRDWLRHGKFNVTQGKNFEKSGALGPWMVTADEIGTKPMRILTRVNGEIRQDDTTDRMIFSIPFLISYISRFCTLEPGDVISTGTPTGAGVRFDPPKFLVPGDVVEIEVSGIGTLRNSVIDEKV